MGGGLRVGGWRCCRKTRTKPHGAGAGQPPREAGPALLVDSTYFPQEYVVHLSNARGNEPEATSGKPCEAANEVQCGGKGNTV